MKMHGHISSETQSPAAVRPSSDGGWRVVFPPAVGTHNPRGRETTRVAPFAHLHIGSFANLHIGSFANLHIGSFANYSLKFSFSAKERDTETGLSYFGARYYSSDLSIWMSVDPMSGKYPSLSPYVYCANNPVKLVDPNGEKIFAFQNDKITKQYLKSYFKENFGSSRMFRFAISGELKVRQIIYGRVYNKANEYQKHLLTGLCTLINKEESVFVKITESQTPVYFFKYDILGFGDDNTPIFGDRKETKLPTLETGGGASCYSNAFNGYLVGLTDEIAQSTQCSTGQYIVAGTYEDVSYPITTSSASSVLFHELLDEVYNYYMNGSTENPVKYQNYSLENLNKTPRDGKDHQE